MPHKTDFIKLYIDVILKKTVAQIQNHKKKKEAAIQTSMSTGETGQGVRSSRHWKAVASCELHYVEMEKYFLQMKELDELTGWSQKLHQDRFHFLSSKYQEVLDEYLASYRMEEVE